GVHGALAERVGSSTGRAAALSARVRDGIAGRRIRAYGQFDRAHDTRSTIARPPASMLLSSSHQPKRVPVMASPPLVVPTAYGPSLQNPKNGPPESPAVASP